MILAKMVTAALLGAAPAPSAAHPAKAVPAQHDMMMMKEADKSIPGDSPIFKNVRLQFVSPKEGEVIAGPETDVTFKLTGYKLPGQGPGPHIHVIVDNQPYQPDYDAAKPFHLTGLSPGPHTLRAFPSRPWHESIKAPHAFALVHFFVGQKEKGKNLANWVDPHKPILTYSRPKGDYSGEDAKSIMIDFYVTNAKLSPKGDKVKLTLDGKEEELTAWKPVWKQGLASGKHTISLDLLDKAGKPIPNVFNHTEREFTVNGAQETVHGAQPAPAPSAIPTH